MQADVDEAIERLKYADKGKLWEMEFEYLRDRSTFDDYLEFEHIKRFNADSVHRIDLKEFDFYGDTCAIEVDIVFIGPTGDTSVQRTTHYMFYDGDRWIRPTFTATKAALELQQEYEAIIRAADSAAKAEAAEGL